MKAAGVILIVLGAMNVLYCGVVAGYGLVAVAVMPACLGVMMLFLGRRLWKHKG